MIFNKEETFSLEEVLDIIECGIQNLYFYQSYSLEDKKFIKKSFDEIKEILSLYDKILSETIHNTNDAKLGAKIKEILL